jgi:hypothetical protein
MLGKYCGNSIPNSTVSSNNEVLIQFHSNGYVTEAGFKMEYHPIGKQNTSIQNNTEYYEDYYIEMWEYYSPGLILAVFFLMNMLQFFF